MSVQTQIPMTKKRAYQVLEIHQTLNQTPANPSLAKIREQYKICALKYHPDKCKLYNANERFREILEAYEYLKEYSNPEPKPNYGEHFDEDDDDGFLDEDDDEYETTPDYKKMIGIFLSNFIRNIWFEDGDKSLQHKLAKLVITKILGLCEKKATEYVRRLDAKTLSKIYEILLKYQDAFHLSASWLETVAGILSEKINGETCVLLNPFLEDLQVDNLYKITENGKTYIVPLWHPELVYDGENTCVDFTVRCCPVLPDHMEIDEHNNVIVKLQYSMKDLWERDTNVSVDVPFGKTTVSFLPSYLRLTRKPQTIRLVEQGISRINRTDMFDNTKRADVVLVITIV
jgi:hypothetical protein